MQKQKCICITNALQKRLILYFLALPKPVDFWYRGGGGGGGLCDCGESLMRLLALDDDDDEEEVEVDDAEKQENDELEETGKIEGVGGGTAGTLYS